MIQGFSGGLLNRQLIYNLDLPSFQRDFASLKTLDHGTGPAITFTRASNATYFDANGVLQTAANNVPRFDHSQDGAANSLGLLIEESRTNHCTNSEASGAIGTNGPTGWFINENGVNGLTRTITQGTLNGFSYIDVRFQGTTTGTTNMRIGDALPSVGATASSGQSWTASAYISLQAGSIPSGATLRLIVRARDSSNTAVWSAQTDISPTPSLVRYVASGTLSGATITQVCHELRLESLTISVAVDFTLRIAAPQLEQGAFPTSYIPTTSAAATRSADSAVVTPISSFYNQSEGALFAEAREGGSDVLYGAASVDTDTSDNRIDIRRSNDASSIGFFVSTGAASQAQLFRTLSASAQTYKAVVAYATNDIAAALNGGAVTSDTSATLPTLTHLRIGGLAATAPSTGDAFHINGHIRKIAYWPRRLSNTLLQQLTT